MLNKLIHRYRDNCADSRWLRPYVFAFGMAMAIIGVRARFDLLGFGV